jgi:hypothetical protein
MARDDLGIPVLLDMLSGTHVEARLVLSLDDVDISLLRDRVRKERKTQSTRFRCGLCHDPVYVSNSGGSSHFAHYSDSGPLCAWRAKLPVDLDAISAIRFGGKQEGELHKRLLLTLKMLCERSRGFSDVGMPNATLFGMPGTRHRFPDLAAMHNRRRVVFELQISKTYLPVISDREAFYRQNGIYLFWLFHNFENWRERQTERDIIALRNRQAFELDSEAIRATLESGSLTLKAHWQVPRQDGASISWGWASKLVAIDDLDFDEYIKEARAANPWRDEAYLLRNMRAEVISKFEKFWFEHDEWSRRLSERTYRRVREGKGVDDATTWTAVMERAFAAILTAANANPELAKRVFELSFCDLLDRLFFLRDKVNRFNKQNLAGALDSVLEFWPHYTETICAVASAYGHKPLLDRQGVQKKINRNLGGGESVPVAQCKDFDRVVALLCPEASAWLRSSHFART